MKQWRKKLFSSPAEHAILSETEHQRKGKFQGPKSCGSLKLRVLGICPCKALGQHLTGDLKILKCVQRFQGKDTEKCQYPEISRAGMAWWHWSSKWVCVLAEEPDPKSHSWDSLGVGEPWGVCLHTLLFFKLYTHTRMEGDSFPRENKW